MTKTIAFLENERFSAEGKPIYVNSSDLSLTSIHDYSLSFEHNKELYKPYWLQKWSNNTKVKGKTIKEHFIYEGQTLWYFFEYIVYFEGKLPHKSISIIIYYIDLVNDILKKEKPDEVIIQNDNGLFYRIVRKVCEKKKVKVKSLDIGRKRGLYEMITSSAFTLKNYFKLKMTLRSLIGLISRKNNTRTDVLLLSNERFCNKSNYSNIFWGTIVKELEKDGVKYNVLEYDMLWDISSAKKMFRRHVLNKNPKTKYIGRYYNSRTRKETKKIARFAAEKWNTIKEDKQFIKSLEYDSINIHEFCAQRFDIALRAFSYFVGDILAVTKEIIIQENPKIVMMDHEMNFYGIGFLIHSKKRDYRTIALQFESVNTRGSVLRYIKSRKIQDKKTSLWRPIADIKCASGEYAKKLLIDICNIPKDTIRITGQPRYDSFVSSNIYDKKKIYKDLGLDPKKKTVVYATKFRDDERQIWEVLKELPKDYQVIFKLAYNNDLHLFERRIGKTENSIITKDYDLKNILAICDVLITVRSTVAMEAMCMGKPVLLADFYKTCTFPYVELRAAVAANSVMDIPHLVKQCVTDASLRKKLEKGRTKFIKDYLCKQDGKASRRIVDILKEKA